MSEDDIEIGDPYSDFVPVLAGYKFDEGPIDIGKGMSLRQEYSEHRNLWTLIFDGNDIVTFDADHFTTTADLGDYIADVRHGIEVDLKAEAGELEEDPRRVSKDDGAAFQ